MQDIHGVEHGKIYHKEIRLSSHHTYQYRIPIRIEHMNYLGNVSKFYSLQINFAVYSE